MSDESALTKKAKALFAQALSNLSPEQPTLGDLKGSMAYSLDRMRMANPEQQGPHLPDDTALERRYYTAMASGLGDTVGSVGKKAAKKVADALPMDEAARMARAKKLGFDTEKTYFHGTKADIDAFDPSVLGASTNAGSAKQGYFFASDASTAGDYAALSPHRSALRGKLDDVRIGAEVDSISKQIAEKYGENWKPPEFVDGLAQRYTPDQIDGILERQNIREVPDSEPLLAQYREASARLQATDVNITPEQLVMRSPSVLKAQERFREAVAAASRAPKDEILDWQRPTPAKKRMEAARQEYEAAKIQALTDIEGQGQNVLPVHLKTKNPYVHDYKGQSYRDEKYADIMKRAKELGHDSVIFKNTYDPADPNNRVLQDIVAVFDPSQVRSKFAAFDPKKKGSGNLSAGIGAAALGAGLMNQDDAMKRRVEGSK